LYPKVILNLPPIGLTSPLNDHFNIIFEKIDGTLKQVTEWGFYQ